MAAIKRATRAGSSRKSPGVYVEKWLAQGQGQKFGGSSANPIQTAPDSSSIASS